MLILYAKAGAFVSAFDVDAFEEDDINGQITNDGSEFDTGRVGVRLLF